MSASPRPVPQGQGEASHLDVARRVLDIEAQALLQTAAALDHRFTDAVELLAATAERKGRVAVAGIGKSGHIARKIAATLASTGTLAFFLHPTEASHGDLGMITSDDALLLLSNSGETDELHHLVAYSKRWSIPLIALVGRDGSTLAERADVALVLPEIVEACSLQLAPTTSTTVMLALGDALAIALFEWHGFSADQFHQFHPGGRLGRQLIRVDEIMHGADALPLTGPDTRMADAILVMSEKQFGVVGIVDGDGRLIGVVTDGDLRRHMSADLLSLTTRAVMTPTPKVVAAGTLAGEAVSVMHASRITSLFVVEGGKPIGFLRLYDCSRFGVT